MKSCGDKVKDLYSEVKSAVLSLGPDVTIHPTKIYIAFHRRQAFTGFHPSKSKLRLDFAVYAQDVYETTWDECVDMYDIFTCAELEEFTEEKFGRTFNHTEPSEVIRDYDIGLYNKCIEDYKEEYDYILNQSDPSTDPCHQALS